MIKFATTLGELRKAVDSWIEEVGEDTPVGVNGDGFLDTVVCMSWVIINGEDQIVGTEGNDDEAKVAPDSGLRNAILIK